MTIRLSALSAILAAALLLAASPALADDLLDAVLWDGPPVSRTVPAPTPPPPPVPDAPSVPSVTSVPATPSTLQPVPAPSASDPVSGDLQQRREIQEMRDRADRLDAALDTPATSPIPVPSWTLSFRGGGGPENKALAASVEFIKRIKDSPFDVALRGSFFSRSESRTGSYKETYYTYDYSWYWGWTSREHTRTHYYDYDVEERHWIGDLECIWRPLRGHPFSPYAGVGARYEHIDHSDKDDDGGLSPAGRVGVVLTVPGFDRLSLKGEFLVGKDSNEAIGEVAIRLAPHFALAAFVDSFDTDLGRGMAFGGGFSLPF